MQQAVPIPDDASVRPAHFPRALLVFAVSAAVLDSRVADVVAGATLPVRLAARRLSDDVGPVIR